MKIPDEREKMYLSQAETKCSQGKYIQNKNKINNWYVATEAREDHVFNSSPTVLKVCVMVFLLCNKCLLCNKYLINEIVF